MAKDKKGSKAATSAPAPVASKPLEAVKNGRVTKPVESAKSVAKDAGKKVAKEVKKASKKVKRDPTPESSSDEADDTSDSSASSDDDSDQEGQNGVKAMPSGKVQPPATGAEDSDIDGDSDSDSSSASDSDDEAAPKNANVPKINGAAKAGSDIDDSSSASDSDEAPKLNGKQADATSDSGDDSDDSSGSSDNSDSGSDSDSDGGVDAKGGAEKLNSAKADSADSSDASSSDDERDVVPKVKVEETVRKRKAEDAIEQTPKKTKVMVNGEYKEAVGNLFVGNLSWNIDEEWLTREFEEFGELSGVRIITDRDSGRSKGYGYVEFTETDSAVQALEAKNGVELDGRNIRIDFSLPRQPKTDGFTPQQRSTDRAQRYGDVPKPPSKTLFVGNVSFNADESVLTELFQDYGTITAVRLPTDRETQQLKGFGYVEFTSIDEAKAAFESLQGAPVEGRPIRLDYAGERSNDSPRGGGGFGRGGGRGGFSDRGGRGGRGGFNDRGRGRGGPRGGRGGTTNRGGFGDFSGKKTSF